MAQATTEQPPSARTKLKRLAYTWPLHDWNGSDSPARAGRLLAAKFDCLWGLPDSEQRPRFSAVHGDKCNLFRAAGDVGQASGVGRTVRDSSACGRHHARQDRRHQQGHQLPVRIRRTGLGHLSPARPGRGDGGGPGERAGTGLNQGDIEFYATPSSAAQGAENGLPIRIVFVAADQPVYLLVGDKGITQVSQLKGKQIAGSTPAQLPALVITTLLQADGLQPADYNIAPASNDPARAALVENHTAAAGILGPNEALPLTDQGYPVIDTALGKVYFPTIGLAVTLDSLAKRRDMVQQAVNASIETDKIITTDKDKTVAELVSQFGLSQANAAKVYDLIKPTYTAAGRTAAKAVQFQLESDAKALNKPAFQEGQIYDYSLLPKA